MFLLKFIKTTTLKGRHNKPSCSEFLTFCNKCKLKEKTGKSHSKRTFSAAKGDRVPNYWTLKSALVMEERRCKFWLPKKNRFCANLPLHDSLYNQHLSLSLFCSVFDFSNSCLIKLCMQVLWQPQPQVQWPVDSMPT